VTRAPAFIAALAFIILLAACASAPPAGDRCTACHEPVAASRVEFDGRPYHPACFERAGPRCGVCGEALTGRRVVAFGPGLDYHESCFTSALRCEVCGFPAVGDRGPAATLADGRRTCAECARTAVNDAAKAQSALGEARALLASELGLEVGSIQVPVALVSRSKLLEQAAEVGEPAIQALTVAREEAPSGDGARGVRGYRIVALYGIPRRALVAILGHELFHVLQVEASPAERDAAFREGSANYIQVVLLRAQGEEPRARLLESVSDSTYGKGLRRFEQLVRARGRTEGLSLGLRAVAFPEGF
jgi:hypothetical protein